ncbi:hypothetical protein [Mycoplasma sp. P36-A1]|uniref:hypothetical protein n=1 Tax=Mycoplasma sp. P36-A1 TaxID=3252900 RepID=UPI003C2AFF6B
MLVHKEIKDQNNKKIKFHSIRIKYNLDNVISNLNSFINNYECIAASDISKRNIRLNIELKVFINDIEGILSTGLIQNSENNELLSIFDHIKSFQYYLFTNSLNLSEYDMSIEKNYEFNVMESKKILKSIDKFLNYPILKEKNLY